MFKLCHSFFHNNFFFSFSLLPPSLALGIVLQNSVNLSYMAGTSVSWRPCLRDQFIQNQNGFFLFSLRHVQIPSHFSKIRIRILMEINFTQKNPDAGRIQTTSRWGKISKAHALPSELAIKIAIFTLFNILLYLCIILEFIYHSIIQVKMLNTYKCIHIQYLSFLFICEWY